MGRAALLPQFAIAVNNIGVFSRSELNGKEGNHKMASTYDGKTGETCQMSGVYKCDTHNSNTIPLSKGERFPPCSLGGGHGTTWRFVRSA